MLTKLRMELDGDFDFKKSSRLHGVISETVDTNYVEKLHISGLCPYSQCLVKEDEKTVWYINTLSSYAKEKIIDVFYNHVDEFIFRDNTKVKIVDKTLKESSYKEIFEEFKDKPAENRISIQFLTPTAFKQNGKYAYFPDLRLIYQSLMNKYDAFSGVGMVDEDTLEQLASRSYIKGYSLHTTRFPLEGITVPGFVGRIDIGINANDTLQRFIRLLLTYGEFCGIGIKTAMGMGAMKINKNQRKENS